MAIGKLSWDDGKCVQKRSEHYNHTSDVKCSNLPGARYNSTLLRLLFLQSKVFKYYARYYQQWKICVGSKMKIYQCIKSDENITTWSVINVSVINIYHWSFGFGKPRSDRSELNGVTKRFLIIIKKN